MEIFTPQLGLENLWVQVKKNSNGTFWTIFKHCDAHIFYLNFSACAICGVLCISLPIPIIVNNFNKFYEKAKIEEEIEAKRKKTSWEDAKRGKNEKYNFARKYFSLQGFTKAKQSKITAFFLHFTPNIITHCKNTVTPKQSSLP